MERLFRGNYATMFGLAHRLVHDEEAARDIVHDVFASLLVDDPSIVTPSYLLRGVRYACLNHIRDISVRSRMRQLYAMDLTEIEDEDWPDEETIALMNDVIDRELSPQTRRVVRLRFSARLTYNEISKELGVSEVAVYKHLRHAINVLRQKINENER